MIKYISIKNVATFPKDGICLQNLKPVNFVYGANGSGKTTISNFLQKPEAPVFSLCSFSWQNEIPLNILVYNKRFREDNFGKGNLAGIFTLGHATKEELVSIEEMNSDLATITAQGVQKKATLEKLNKDASEYSDTFKELIWQAGFKKNEHVFKEALRGFIGSKDSFRDKIIEKFHATSTIAKTRDELEKAAKEILLTEPQHAAKLVSPSNITRLIAVLDDAIWTKKIIGKSDVEIAKLIQHLNMNDWVNKGRSYIQADTEICPFCQKKTIDTEFRKKLECFFDTDFTQAIEYLKKAASDFAVESSTVQNFLLEVEKNEENNVQTKLDLNTFKAARLALVELLTLNDAKIQEKLAEPSRSVELFPIHSAVDNISKVIDIANAEIEKWNQLVVNYTKERANLVNDIWNFIVDENRAILEEYQKKILGMKKGISIISSECATLRTQYRELELKIKNANKNVTSVQPTIDEINRILSMYGFSGFTIVPAKNGNNQYQIQRSDGSLAETTLSEGEITFLTFLYFLQLAKGSLEKENISDNRILVIDDPISSLDSSVLFVVSSLIKEIIKNIKTQTGNIKQLILLTHNVYFHKEVSFIDGRTKESPNVNFWILRKQRDISSIQAYETKNPIKNSYELLWQELQHLHDIQSCITIQNIMRRIIEEYFKTLGGYTDASLLDKFTIPEEKEICRSLISWINDGSHCITDSLFVEHSTETIQKYHDIFRRIFTETNHGAHYNMMMHIEN